ncbi:MAG: FAD-dependent oxidoreductase [Nostoc sp.]|uniref:FAD-dependent oxidoreductase n=1 Tax=Nostoc sp. TaxID=1180 RepID=UPI002FF68944
MNPEYYDDIIIGSGKAGKTLAPSLVADGRKTALVERSLTMIGGGCINIACIPTKTMVASAEVANTVRHSAAYGVKANAPIVDLAAVIGRKRSVGLAAKFHSDAITKHGKLLSRIEVENDYELSKKQTNRSDWCWYLRNCSSKGTQKERI